MTFEVRCCCTPKKLRGWIDVPGNNFGWCVRFPIMSKRRKMTAELPRVTFVELKFDMYRPDGGGKPYMALKSEDIPISKLRRIRGFRENLQ